MFAIFTDDGLDQIVETKALAAREASDLRAMGCKVKILEGSETDFDTYDTEIRERGYL